MKKSIWLTSLSHSEALVKTLMGQLQKLGLIVNGHFWQDELDKNAWVLPREEMLSTNSVLWAIVATEEELRSESLRYGLSMLALSISAEKGLAFPIVILLAEGTITEEDLPTPLKGADILSMDAPAFGAKLVAKIHSIAKPVTTDYRLDVYGNPHIGQWFEVGPKDGSWQGAMFGVAGANVIFHGVGPKGRLPEKSVLNYPSKDLKLQLGEKEFIAWALQNSIDKDTSYFVKIEGFPEKILFGPYSQDEATDVYTLNLK